MILSAGCVQSNKKMCFARKAKIKSEVFTKLQTGPVQVGKVPAYLFRDHGGTFCTDINLSNFPGKKYILFSFGVCFPKTVSYRPKHARKCLISNVILNNFSWLSNCYRIFNEIINICTQK